MSGADKCHYACRYFREGYLNAMAELIQRELQKFDRPEKTEIFFSAHGVPVSYVEQVHLALVFTFPSYIGALPRCSIRVLRLQALIPAN